ncbi:MAG: ATP synthase F1 subunit epsilon [Holophagaceae bacterium]|jgi:F-type H+-transporting ATPase subunit epsilon|nr:ATP synthase F1 subunit epsilon [Holophagaceae bacterium]
MVGHLKLEIVTPGGKIFSSDVSELQFPTAYRGYYGILPDHTPVLTPLGDGLISCLIDGKRTVLTVFGGFAEVGPTYVKILARESETAETLNLGAISERLNDAENQLRDAKTPEKQHEIQATIAACKIKLSALE